jgi:N-acetylmuramoyl-L-alanine amidase
LQERADVVNNHHADLFICIHTNSAQSSSAYGTETFTLGLAKTRANLDVAMRENSVILLEEDYKTKYKGFDPNSVDSYIMFEFMQDKYIDRSIDFSSSIQKQFVNYSHRSDRGVRQAGFWVLHRSACPSVLIELGFISNPSEERYLNSEAGQKEMATAIFNAFVDYKRVHDKKSGKQLSGVLKYETPIKKEEIVKSEEPVKIEEPKKAAEPVKITPVAPKLKEKTIIDSIVPKAIEIKNKVVSEPKSINIPTFKVQFLASMKPLKSTSAEFKGLKDFEHYIEGGLYKYTVGNETDYSKIVTIRKGLLSKFPEAFIIAFVNEKKMTAKEALKLIK